MLSEDHLKHLSEGSGLAQEVIDARGYRTVTEPKQLRELGFSRQQAQSVPGLLLPIHCTDGQSGGVVYRPDIPRVVEDRRKRNPDGTFKTHVIKYELPKGAGVRIDCPPVCRSQLANPDKPLWITEGQKKADALASRGFVAVDLLGVWNFKGRNEFGGITWLADWDYVALKGREVRIVFDSDVMTKPAVRGALDRLTEHLQRRGALITAVYLPPQDGKKVGVDDFLLTHTIDELEALVEAPRRRVAPAAPQIELLESEPLAMRRPIVLINGRSYVAIWPYLRLRIHEEEDKDGNVVRYDEPKVVEEQRLLVVRDDGITFGDGGFQPFSDLDLNVFLNEIPQIEHRWSTPSIIKFRDGHKPDPALVFQRIADVVDRLIDFDLSFASQRTMAEMVACYTLATWFLDGFNVMGYLWSNGERGSGKSKLLLIVSQLAYLGQFITNSGSFAAIRDLADYGATLCFDDAENISDPKSDPDKRALLLAGNRRGNTVPVKELGTNNQWRIRYINSFCPRLFSAIRLPDPILASRSIIIPLVKSGDKARTDIDAFEFDLWPHDRQGIIDDCWVLALTRLAELPEYDRLAARQANLVGRALEPWRAILAVSLWLTHQSVPGLWKRIHETALAYQGERRELESTDMTALVIRSLVRALGLEGDVLTRGDVFREDTPTYLKTKDITDTAKALAEEEELSIDLDRITGNRIGWILKRLRLPHHRQSKTGARGWAVTPFRLQKYVIAFNLYPPEKTSPLVKTSPLPEVPPGSDGAAAGKDLQIEMEETFSV